MAFNSTVLDAPDTAVRRIMLKRSMGQPITTKEMNRLATRASVEAETNRAGGAVRMPITPRTLSPEEQGAADRQYNDAYAGGRNGAPVRRAPAATPPAQAPTNPAATAPTPPATSAARPGGIDVRSYVGSRYAGNNNPMGITPATPATPPSVQRAPTLIAGRFNGANVNPTAPDPTVADQTSPPPAKMPSTVLPASNTPQAPGTVRKMTPEQIEAERKKRLSAATRAPLALPTE